MIRISLLFVLGLIVFTLVGCGEVEMREKTLPDGSNASVTATGEINDVFVGDIENKLLDGYKQIAVEEVDKLAGYNIITPEYLPERFEHYGIFIRDNPGIPTEKMVRQLWYATDKNEVLMVTLMKSEATSEGRFIFTEKLEASGKISDVYPWAKYRCQYEFSKNGIYVQGYMFVNDENNKNEYEKILKSLNSEFQSLEGYNYDEQTGRYVNETTGIWYVVEDGYKIIPPE